jgi:hypothetical protein
MQRRKLSRNYGLLTGRKCSYPTTRRRGSIRKIPRGIERKGRAMSNSTLIIVIVVLILLFGGGGFYWRGRRR